ncbi:histone-like nucleoid-structuring protein Lsr2 [Nonomuraea sp. NPDC046802]|uniref:Lsr2 family DNA-binding protein n=1 Tax=Nonomuraea sp. NPDC046802 TaxID=3154919 RepID=UPI0033DB19B0
MTTAVINRPHQQQAITPAYAHALLLLTEGHTPKDAAAATGVPVGRLSDLAREQGWAIHPTTQRVTDRRREKFTPILAPELQALAATWPGINECTPLGASKLLAAAADCDNPKVQTALGSAMKALDKLRTVYADVEKRRVAAVQRETAKKAAAEYVAELKQQLDAARQRAKALGVSTTSSRSSAERELDNEIRDWAKAHQIPVGERGQISRDVRARYKAAHR